MCASGVLQTWSKHVLRLEYHKTKVKILLVWSCVDASYSVDQWPPWYYLPGPPCGILKICVACTIIASIITAISQIYSWKRISEILSGSSGWNSIAVNIFQRLSLLSVLCILFPSWKHFVWNTFKAFIMSTLLFVLPSWHYLGLKACRKPNLFLIVVSESILADLFSTSHNGNSSGVFYNS